MGYQARLIINNGILGQVQAVEAYVNRNVTGGEGLPIIDGYQTLEGDRVYLNQQRDLKQNGIWTVHDSPISWERPAWFANGMTFQGGQIVFVDGGTGQTQFNFCLIKFDNAADFNAPFIVGIDAINSDSINENNAIPPVNFLANVQGPFASMCFGSTSSDSSLGAGQPLFDPAGQHSGIDWNGETLINGNLIFPDSDPHVNGAAYWVAGVLTRSNG